jgi:hypothetical protein
MEEGGSDLLECRNRWNSYRYSWIDRRIEHTATCCLRWITGRVTDATYRVFYKVVVVDKKKRKRWYTESGEGQKWTKGKRPRVEERDQKEAQSSLL